MKAIFEVAAAIAAMASGILWFWAARVPLHIDEWWTETVGRDVAKSGALNAWAATLTGLSGILQGVALLLPN